MNCTDTADKFSWNAVSSHYTAAHRRPIDTTDDAELAKIVKSCVGTKMMKKYEDLAVSIAVTAVRTVAQELHGRKEIDIKRYAKVEKVPGGELTESRVIQGVMLNKDVTHSSMRRR